MDTITSATSRTSGLPPGRRSPRKPLRLSHAQCAGLLVILGAATLAAAFVLGPGQVLLGLAVMAGALVVAVGVAVPAIAMCVLLVGEFTNVSEVFGESLPVSIYVANLSLATASVAAALFRPRYRARVRLSGYVPVYLFVFYLVTTVPSAAMSQDPQSTGLSLANSFKDLVFLVVALLLFQLADRPWWAAAAIVVPLAGLSALVAIHEFVLHNVGTLGGFSNIASTAGSAIATPRHAGPLQEPNFWGRFLILGLPLGLALVHRSTRGRHPLPQIGWSIAVGLIGVGIYLSQSRGTLLATAAAILVWIVASGPRMRRRALYLSPLLFPLLLVPGVGDRLLTLTETVSGPAYAADASLVERQQLQLVAWGVFRENILFGAGPSSFATVMREYAPLTSAGSTGNVTAVVNLYLEIAAETGIVGLVGWTVFVGGMVVLSVLGLIRLAGGKQNGADNSPTRSLAAGTAAALIGWSVVSVTLQMSYARTLLTLCALIGLLYSVSRADTDLQTPAALTAIRRAARGLRLGMVVVLSVAASSALVATALTNALSVSTHVATTELTLLATSETWGGYATDVRRRGPVLPAYAAVVRPGSPQPETTVDADPVRGVITVRAVGATAQEAQLRRDAVVDGAADVVQRAGMDRAYRIVPVTAPSETTERVLSGRGLRVVVLGVLLDVALVLAGAAWFHRGHRRDRQPPVQASRPYHGEPVRIPMQREHVRL